MKYAQALSNRPNKKAALSHVAIHPSDDGGHIVRHHHDGEYEPRAEHVFEKGSHHEMLAHVANALKLPEVESAKEDKAEGGKEE